MRQVGILAAAALYALEHNVARLAEDHLNARTMAEHLAGCKRIILDPKTVQTNILVFDLTDDAPPVTHLNVSRAQCEQAARIIIEVIESFST